MSETKLRRRRNRAHRQREPPAADHVGQRQAGEVARQDADGDAEGRVGGERAARRRGGALAYVHGAQAGAEPHGETGDEPPHRELRRGHGGDHERRREEERDVADEDGRSAPGPVRERPGDERAEEGAERRGGDYPGLGGDGQGAEGGVGRLEVEEGTRDSAGGAAEAHHAQAHGEGEAAEVALSPGAEVVVGRERRSSRGEGVGVGRGDKEGRGCRRPPPRAATLASRHP
mmetsp:Transcript_4608/g.18957  ORF Transcript_4608/g.18957 Transcript_4608/m.18957 type:complete len:231 (+) Transcript_4608:1007-1699(+)